MNLFLSCGFRKTLIIMKSECVTLLFVIQSIKILSNGKSFVFYSYNLIITCLEQGWPAPK
jgi:hypothetical protein